jgi:hypothetical protein
MAKRFLTPINLASLSSDPLNGSEGDLYFNTVTNTVRVYYDGAWNNSIGEVGTPLNVASTVVKRDSDQSFDITAIDFDTADTISQALGRLRWNSAEGTISLGISSTKDISIGEDQIYRVRNSTGSTLNKGVAVYASGIEPSGRIDVSPYVADGSVREVRFMGLVAENISNGVNGFVQNFGYVTGLDTRGTSSTAISVGDENWAAGDILYVHPTVAGKLTNVKPQHEITVAIIIKRHQSEGVLFVRPSSGGHLEDIHDISIASPVSGEVLSYESSTGVWKNTSIVQSGSSYPTTNLNNGNLFYNTTNGRTAIYFNSVWRELEYASPLSSVTVLDGGNSSTTEYTDIFDGGNSSTPVFIGNIDGD